MPGEGTPKKRGSGRSREGGFRGNRTPAANNTSRGPFSSPARSCASSSERRQAAAALLDRASPIRPPERHLPRRQVYRRVVANRAPGTRADAKGGAPSCEKHRWGAETRGRRMRGRPSEQQDDLAEGAAREGSCGTRLIYRATWGPLTSRAQRIPPALEAPGGARGASIARPRPSRCSDDDARWRAALHAASWTAIPP